MKKLLTIFCALAAILLTGCDNELDERTTLTFIGDSFVARWDLQNSFSSLATTNMGRSGAHIDYIEQHAGQMTGKNVVVIIGTNESFLMAENMRDGYVDKYLSAILGLDAKKVYLYDVFPRAFAGDRGTINSDIRAFNAVIAEKVKSYPQITYLQVYDLLAGDHDGINPEYYMDGLHINPQGYEILADKLFKYL